MTHNREKNADFYAELFGKNPDWSTPYPNLDEARRWAKIDEFLSQIQKPNERGDWQRLRILDVGCGRGWLTRLAGVYGSCEGVDPIANTIRLASEHFPDLTFHVGTAANVLCSKDFEAYDVVISSEVIEHVLDKENFVQEIKKCLVPAGHAIITTPRGEEFRRYRRVAGKLQPVETWVTESELRSLFERNGFKTVRHERAYIDIPRMSLLHLTAYASERFSRVLERLGLSGVRQGLRYRTAIYQAWWFQLE
jgi:2-polyprenyl-3-methyl-5-hydroxy-6-metoxy-1,4-benzoquinol methylase